ncbi:alpha/beta fold hydrolase [Haladaptatus halobius]|uniref:alpha/beta fold hydrolase n=1 Tax=Haladaptatus halobius TaxID=2884875 RepID=UPI001D09A978|nr:alpha/beta fold hydrolase [Haladaptatus halobius]
MTELAHDEAVVDGVRLHYVEAGDGPLVVLLHGFPEFWYSWREQIPALVEAGFRVVAPDMRGYNTSEKPRGVGQYRLDKLVGDVVALVDHFDEETAHVVGHDWGGLVAWETAIRHPEHVERLAVLNAPHPGRYREAIRSPEQLLRSWYALFFQLPKLPELLLSARNYAGIEGMLRGSAENPDAFTERDIRRYVEAAARPGALTASIDYYRAAFRENAREELRVLLGGTRRSFDVCVPTLLIWGERDPALAVELTDGLERWVSDIRVERLPEVGHGVQNDRPDHVNELLVEFFGP